MKQLLLRLCKKYSFFLLFALLFSSNVLYAEDLSFYDNTTWNVIRERLFNGENTYASRFEENIRFQVIGAKNHQDSAVFTQLIDELNELMETVQITLVDKDPNFRLTFENEQGGRSYGSTVQNYGNKIILVRLKLVFSKELSDKESIQYIYYHTLRQLTKLYHPRNSATGYGGIFDSPKAIDSEFKEIDKNLIKHLYSRDFYKNLKENTVSTQGYHTYLELRYKKLITNFSLAFKTILLIIVFLFFLSKESKRKPNPSLLLYLKQRLIILLTIPLLLSSIQTSGNFTLYLFTETIVLFTNYLIGSIYALLVFVTIYYTEPFFLKKIKNFIGKQVFIFISTHFAAFIVPGILIFFYFLFSNSVMLSQIRYLSIWSTMKSGDFLILTLATLRVFYNIITYRIKSMVNQKDVEIAKMKELKNQAELNALHSRINPHFLYNSLNSIASLAHIDADKTETMATGLSELFRYSINKENKTYVTVAEELEMVTKYLEIEKTRFGKRLVYEINTDESTLKKQIPKFLIQPLVENAIKHGLSKIKETGKIVVEIKQVDKALTISIFDNGPDFPAEPVSGYGLQNLNDKLDIIYGEKASINWENNPSKHVKITLKNQF